MKTHRKILGAVSAMIILLSCMTAVLPLDVSADGMADIIFAAAKAYVDIKQNEVTKEGLLAAVPGGGTHRRIASIQLLY